MDCSCWFGGCWFCVTSLDFGLCGYVVAGCLFCVNLVHGCGLYVFWFRVVLWSILWVICLRSLFLLVWLNCGLWVVVRLGLHIVVILV